MTLGEGSDDFILVRETPFGLLGEDELAIDDDVELAGLADDELRFDADLSLERGRETRGAGFVVSNVAVLDLDFVLHARELAAGRDARQVEERLSPRRREGWRCRASGC